MKILYYTYPWAMDVMGGGERQMLAYANHLPKFGIQPAFYDMWRPSLDGQQIFHLFSVMPGVIEMCDYAKKRGLKLVVSPNIWVTRETKDNYPYQTIWNLLELADRVIVNSDMEGNTLSDVYGMRREKFFTVHNAVETDFLLPADPALFRQKFGIDGPYVLNVANIEPRKNQLEFIRALREVRPDLTLVIAGSVRDKEYADACAEAGAKNLRIIGALPYASELLRSAIIGCEFFAMPSLLETPSIAAIEAAAVGAKILLTSAGSVEEYFGQSVTYVDPFSRASMRDGIAAVITATTEHLTWGARHRFLWPKVMPELVRCYESLQ